MFTLWSLTTVVVPVSVLIFLIKGLSVSYNLTVKSLLKYYDNLILE